MNAESTVPASLSPRAAVAMLSLQLRAAVQEADTAEADANSVDEAAARQQLRDRLEPLIAERRRALDESLAAARGDAAAAITAARDEARRMIERSAAAAEARRAELAASVYQRAVIAEPEPEVEPEWAAELAPEFHHEPQVEVETAELFEPELVEPDVIEPEVVEPDLIEAELVEPEVVEPEVIEPEVVRPEVVQPEVVVHQQGAPLHVTVSIDADAFAAAFAQVFANILEERMGSTQAAFAPRMALGPMMMMPEQMAAKRSFWSNARHLDVALVGLATTIVLVVLAAWLV
jgi:chemosensory pili system protein ChpA (sensor histidine kinase/response regulator)